MTDIVPIVDGTIVPGRPTGSVRDVDAALWEDEAAARGLAVKIWLDSKESRHTREAYERDIGYWFAWCDENDVPVDSPRRADVDEWRNDLADEPHSLSPATIARRLSVVSSFYAYWLSENIVTRNPAAEAKRPKVSAAPVSIWLTRHQAADLLTYVDHMTDPRPGVIVRLLAETGMRVGELCNARVADLGMSGGHHILTVTRKGGKKQKLPVAGGTWERITNYLDGRTDGWLLLVRRTDRRTGDGRMLRGYVRELLRRIAKEAGLPDEVWEHMHPHVLRHSAATLLAEDQVPLHEIQRLLGHADLRTTQRYIHYADDLDASPVYRLARLLAQK